VHVVTESVATAVNNVLITLTLIYV